MLTLPVLTSDLMVSIIRICKNCFMVTLKEVHYTTSTENEGKSDFARNLQNKEKAWEAARYHTLKDFSIVYTSFVVCTCIFHNTAVAV